MFDVKIASDCLFFLDFHADLLETLRRLLKPDTGVGIFLQPRRDGTMGKFIDRCKESAFFTTELQEDYCPKVRAPYLLYLRRACAVVPSVLPSISCPYPEKLCVAVCDVFVRWLACGESTWRDRRSLAMQRMYIILKCCC
jgi:hypothetical protein